VREEHALPNYPNPPEVSTEIRELGSFFFGKKVS